MNLKMMTSEPDDISKELAAVQKQAASEKEALVRDISLTYGIAAGKVRETMEQFLKLGIKLNAAAALIEQMARHVRRVPEVVCLYAALEEARQRREGWYRG